MSVTFVLTRDEGNETEFAVMFYEDGRQHIANQRIALTRSIYRALNEPDRVRVILSNEDSGIGIG